MTRVLDRMGIGPRTGWRGALVVGLLAVGCTSDGGDDRTPVPDTDPGEDSAADSGDPVHTDDTDGVAVETCVQAVARPAGAPTILVPQSFAPTALVDSIGVRSCLVVHDLDQDGHLDVLWGKEADDVAQVVVRWGLGGRQGVVQRRTVDHLPYACLVGDDDGDGDLEVLYADATGLARLDGLAARSWTRSSVWTAPETTFQTDVFSLSRVDLDGDGDEDVIVTLSGYVTDCSEAATDSDGDVILTTDDIDPGVVMCLERTDAGWAAMDAEPCPQALRDHETVYPFHVSLQDLGDDGIPEILATGDFAPNTMLRSTPEGFEDISEVSGLATYNHAMGVAWFDQDRDGRRDAYLSDFGADQLQLNADCERFFDGAHVGTGIGEATYGTVTWGVVAEDLDDNGDEEVFLTQNVESSGPLNGNLCALYPAGLPRPPDFVLQRDGAGVFRRHDLVSLSLPNAYAWMPAYAGAADLDGDGRIDLIGADEVRGIVLYWNELARAGRWVGIEPVDAAGLPVQPVRVVVDEGDGHERIKEAWPSTGTSIQPGPVLRFGLGPRETPVDVRVRWPDGTWTDHPGVALDSVTTVVRPTP